MIRSMRRMAAHLNDHSERNWRRYVSILIFLVVSFIGAYIGAVRGDNAWTRAGVFFLVAAVLLTELIVIVGNTKEDTWDGLAISMAFFRASVVNYIGSLAIAYMQGSVDSYPAWWWTSARTVMGLFAAISLFFLAIETRVTWQHKTTSQRVRAILAPIVYVGLVSAIAYFM